MGATAFYNEIDPLAAATIREAIAAGVIALGVVDERDIRDIRPDELVGFTQVHLFAGGGLWSYALRRARWPDDRPAWTCSCPCQPFSAAGKGGGFDDERHLWPAAQWLIDQCRPERLFGEQVADKGADLWVDLVQADLEAMGYAFGCVPLASAGFGAPNPRHRSFWVADASGSGCEGIGGRWEDGAAEHSDAHWLGNSLRDGAEPVGGNCDFPQGTADCIHRDIPGSGIASRDAGAAARVEYADSRRWQARAIGSTPAGYEPPAIAASGAVGMGDTARIGHERSGLARRRRDGLSDSGDIVRLAHAHGSRLALGSGQADGRGTVRLEGETSASSGIRGSLAERSLATSDRIPGPVNGFWANADWLLCRDPRGARWRPVDAGTFPLAPGHPGRVGGLRVSGNAINAEVATAFIETVIDHLDGAPLEAAA